MIRWTSDEIENILNRLDEMGLPFGKGYEFSRENGRLKRIGQGGFAYVYEMCSRRFGKKPYALKILGFSDTHADSEIFKDEVSVQNSVALFSYQESKNVVKISDHTELWLIFGEEDDLISVEREKPEKMPRNCIKLQFVLMERLTPVIGRNLSGVPVVTPEALAGGDEKEIIKIALHIGTALKLSHERKVLHRDVKLENVFYSEKEKKYKLGDFGIAKQTEDGFAGTRAFTYGYAAPEVRGTPGNDRYDHTADIYSFGMMLYVLANKLRFPDSKSYSVNSEAQYKKGYVVPVPDNESISPEFYKIIAKACMYDPADRYQSMKEMLADIEALKFPEKIRYRVKNKNQILVAGNALLVIGIIAWKLILAPNLEPDMSFAEYLFLAGCIGKGVLNYLKRKQGLVDFVMFCIGVYLLSSTGFSWVMLLVMLWMVFSSGVSSGYVGGCVLLADLVARMQRLTGAAMDVNAGQGWIAITLISVSVILLYEYVLISVTDIGQNGFKWYIKGVYRAIYALFYIFCIMCGAMEGVSSKSLSKLFGARIADMIMSVDLLKVGVAGLVFCAIWTIGEKVEKRRKRVDPGDGHGNIPQM